MPSRPVTPYSASSPVLSGHFNVGPDYDTYRPNGTGDFLIILTCGGHGRFVGPDGEWLSSCGDACLLRAGVAHDYSTAPAAQVWELKWIHFTPNPDWLDLLNWPTVANGVGHLRFENASVWREVLTAWQGVHRAELSADALRDRWALNAVESLLLTCARHNPNRHEHLADSVVQQAIGYISTHLNETLSVDRLAAQAGLSASRFAHRFRQAVGQSPAAFVEHCRLRRAVQLLTSTSLSVKEITGQLGFSTQFYFSLRFKKFTGHSPTTFRARSRLPDWKPSSLPMI